MPQQIRHILENMTSQGYRSNATKPLLGSMVLTAMAGIVAWKCGAVVISYIMIALTIVSSILFFIAYFICLVKDPNLLRSERFNLEKIALEKACMQSTNGHISAKPPMCDYVEIVSSVKELEG